MSGERGVRSLSHRALEPARPGARPLADAELGDRLRVGVLLQGAGLLSLLHRAGWHLAHGWRAARVSADGALHAGGAAVGAPRGLPQERLRELLTLLFGETIAGRGDGRRAARDLQAGWRQSFAAVAVDDLVGQILAAAPFLFTPSGAASRRALAGAYAKNGTATPWVAGPPRWRELVLAAAAEVGDPAAVLGSDAAATLWRRAAGGNERARGGEQPSAAGLGGATAGPPRDLGGLIAGSPGGRAGAPPAWRTVLWGEHQPPVQLEERVALAAALAGLGKYRRALAALEGLADTPAVGLVRARCQGELGDLAGARDTLRRLERARLAPDEVACAVEIALDVLAGIEPQSLERWLHRGAELPAGEARARVLVLLAARESGAAAEQRLAAARALLSSPEHAWRWHRVRAQRAAADGEVAVALAHLGLALGESRRALTRAVAGGLWSQLARARAEAETLSSAERAFRHAARLFAGCDGDRRSRGARYRLAELRLRRGETQGVADILAESAPVHARAGDHRSAAFDAVLRARLDLVVGQPHAALAHCRAALADLDRRGLDHGRAELRALAALALGWLGARDEAAAELSTLASGGLAALEREERPAVLALAGQREAALAEAADSPFARLWRAALTGHAAPEAAWMELRALDRYRQARLVLDLELTAPGVTPLYWLRRAKATLQRVGAEPLAARLEPRKRGGWEAVESYLRSPADAEALPRLFFTAGYPEARLLWSRGSRSERGPAERVLVDGGGGAEELSAPAGGGLLTLRAPLLDPTLRALFALALRDLDAGGARPASGDAVRGGLLGDSPLLLAAIERLALLAPGELPLLILGETGTGKELLAKQAHALSRRAAGPFVPMNCAAVSEHLLLSELFGHVRGAFTGADRDRVGVFETAKGGTVFLDEIGDLPPNAQGMLLRALQEGEIRRVGETLPRRIDVRVVAATHRDLLAMVKAAAFRQDLFYRLRGATVTLPPLRERGEDVVALAEHFLARAARPARLSARARAVVLGHPWPGNVRELKNCMEVAAMLSAGHAVQPEHIDLPSAPARAGASYHQRVDALRRDLLVEALQLSGGRRAEAARRLGLTRQAMAYLVKQLDL